MVYYFLRQRKLYMKHLLILVCVFTLVSCGIKNKIWNTTNGKLGVSKQPTQQLSSVNIENTTSAKVHQKTLQSQPLVLDKPLPWKKLSEPKWYYAIPFLGLIVLALLVYRLKKQNLESL